MSNLRWVKRLLLPHSQVPLTSSPHWTLLTDLSNVSWDLGCLLGSITANFLCSKIPFLPHKTVHSLFCAQARNPSNVQLILHSTVNVCLSTVGVWALHAYKNVPYAVGCVCSLYVDGGNRRLTPSISLGLQEGGLLKSKCEPRFHPNTTARRHQG